MENTKKIASGAMLCALCLAVLLLGSTFEIGMYALPLFAGIMLMPYGGRYGKKAQFTVFTAVGILSFMLIPNVEQNLIFTGFFGWYPIFYPRINSINKPLRLAVKLLIFNSAVISIELLLIKLLVPEVVGTGFVVVLLLLANLTFIIYDKALPVIYIRLAKFQKYM